MSVVLSRYTRNRDNNFNLIRFIAAIMVLYTHSYALSGNAEPLGNRIGMTWGSIAVDVFFVTSGFLIASSFFGRSNIIAFFWARVLRIYPALIVAVMFCVLIVGLHFTTDVASDYLSSNQTYSYFKNNIILFFGVSYQLPGVFEDNPFKGSVNGSLWTLPYEVKMYAYLAIIGFVTVQVQKWLNRDLIKIIFLGIAIVAIVLNIYNHFNDILKGPFLHLFSMFFSGVAYYVCCSNIYLSKRLFSLFLVTLLFTLFNKEVFFILYCVLLPYLIFFTAYVPSGKIKAFNKIGDYSYGIYIYAFPVQQSIAATIPNVTVVSMIMLSFTITLLLSIVSWHLIEKNFLKMKDRYIYFEIALKEIYLMFVTLMRKLWPSKD